MQLQYIGEGIIVGAYNHLHGDHDKLSWIQPNPVTDELTIEMKGNRTILSDYK